jgi:CheY-like chemotaxis protein
VNAVRGSIGQLLIAQGVIDAGALSDALARQSSRHPVCSELYALGYASERDLCAALSAQTGWPAIVLDESTIRLDVLEHVSIEWARIFSAIIVYEDASTIVVAAARPEDAIVPARELGASRNKNVELRIALDITLARTIRVAFTKWKHGDQYLVGNQVDRPGPHLAVVHPDEGEDDQHRQAQRALAEEAARNIETNDELPSEDHPSSSTLTGDWHVNTITTSTDVDEARVEERTSVLTAELDRGGDEAIGDPDHIRALVIDPDPPGRIKLVAELEKLGYECQSAAAGTQAVVLMSHLFFDFVFADVATPEIDGLQLCRAIKRSRRLVRTKVIVTTSDVDSGQVPDEVLQRHAADGYLEKPLEPRRLHRLLRDMSPEERANDHEAILADALGRYHNGDIEGAISRLRGALVGDPASPKLHFMLANMLQRASRWAEAVDEYEAVIEIQPAYFPALTRLAYLYFRQGLHARAVETWRRALPVCDDPALRRNIELFMRKLVADMSKSDTG